MISQFHSVYHLSCLPPPPAHSFPDEYHLIMPTWNSSPPPATTTIMGQGSSTYHWFLQPAPAITMPVRCLHTHNTPPHTHRALLLDYRCCTSLPPFLHPSARNTPACVFTCRYCSRATVRLPPPAGHAALHFAFAHRASRRRRTTARHTHVRA